MTETAEAALSRLLAVMARLRDPAGGCPWDLEQTFATIAPYTIEEAYEVEGAIRRDDPAAIKDELGDLLFQVVYHARLAEERGWFDFAAVAATIGDKMIRRHPHVFGEDKTRTSAEQTLAWESQKQEERARRAESGVLAGVAPGLPALTRAAKLTRRAARVGFDWPDAAAVLDKLEEEAEELRREFRDGVQLADPERLRDEVGDLLFVLANLARKLDIDPEESLRGANAKFESRFRFIEQALFYEGKSAEDQGLDRLEALWKLAKEAERRP